MTDREIFMGAPHGASKAELEAYLDEACAGDAGLRAQVEAMFAAEAKAGHFMTTGTARGGSPAVPPGDVGDDLVGSVIGNYRLEETIGHGGFGVVYRARQDSPVTREVALKVIKPGMDSRQVINRFEAERQALAMMDHPHIAHVYEAGSTGGGRPYFVMELVAGDPITEFCDRARLGLRDRLRLFIDVCHAVQHAHQKGIVHRDLKPSNILVERIGGRIAPKVIDFGIAKAMSQPLVDATLVTRQGQMIGTPAYMSPEQARLEGGGDIDTRSDVYSLGVLLYELITGTTPLEPHRITKAGYLELKRMISEEEPPRPSTRVSSMDDQLEAVAARRSVDPTRLGRQLRRDLDWIAIKALEKDRDRRYTTVNALAEDIRRFLANETVSAVAPSRIYRASKFVKRHRAGVASMAAVMAALATASAISIDRANVARREATKSREVATLLKEMLRTVGPTVALGRDTVLLREILDKAVVRLDEDALRRQPQVRAELLVTLGDVYRELGEYETAADMLREAVGIREHLGRGHEEELAEALTGLGWVLGGLADRKAQEAAHQRALDIMTRLHGERHEKTLSCLNDLAACHAEANRHAEELALRERILELALEVLGEDHEDVTKYLGNLANCYVEDKRLQEAFDLRQRALDLTVAVYGEDHLFTTHALASLAFSLDDFGRLEESIELQERALALRAKLIGRENLSTQDLVENLGVSYWKVKRLDKSIPLFEEAHAIYQARLGPDHPKTLGVKANLGVNYSDAGRKTEGIRLLEDVHGVAKERPEFAYAGSMLAAAYRSVRRFDDAMRVLIEAAEWTEAGFGPEHPKTVAARNQQAVAHWERREFDESIPLLQELLAIQTRTRGLDHPDTLTARANLGVNLGDSGRVDDGLEHLEQAWTLARGEPRLAWIGEALMATYRASLRYGDVARIAGELEAADRPGQDDRE